MLDRFDMALLDAVQSDDSRTALELAREVPLSPSAIARRLRRLRADGWIQRTIALLSPRLLSRRLRAIVFIQLNEHADRKGIAALINRLLTEEQVQLAYEISGIHDIILVVDCADMAEYNRLAEEIIATDPTVRRYETSFVKREIKFAPFARLTER